MLQGRRASKGQIWQCRGGVAALIKAMLFVEDRIELALTRDAFRRPEKENAFGLQGIVKSAQHAIL